MVCVFFFQAEDGIRAGHVTGVQTCALPILVSRLLVSHVPIDTESFDLRFGVMVRKNPSLSEDENRRLAEIYVGQNQEAFFQDVEIWHTKTRVDNPVLCDGDGPVNRLRQWYQQFYQDLAEVGDTWDERKEYVIEFEGQR